MRAFLSAVDYFLADRERLFLSVREAVLVASERFMVARDGFFDICEYFLSTRERFKWSRKHFLGASEQS